MIIAPSILNAAPVEFSGNGHYYELIEERLSWSDARDSAVSMGGYLATITSQEEDDFIDNVFNGYFWIGGYQLEGSTEPDGGWQWVTGEDWSYTNWFSGEPSNSVGAEDSIEIGRFSGSYWRAAIPSKHLPRRKFAGDPPPTRRSRTPRPHKLLYLEQSSTLWF